MDAYPSGSLEHNVPFLVASGFDCDPIDLPPVLQEHAIHIKSELPPLESKESIFLESYFEEVDDKGSSWTLLSSEESYRFRITSVGRSLFLPPRKAFLPESAEPPTSPPILHSPYSPLSPSSPLYPDGLINDRWVEKHQEFIPSVFACFYHLSGEPTTTTLNDNRLKTDINAIKAALARSGYKTRLAVIILGERENKANLISDVVAERLENIRKGSGLDPKSIFYIPPQDTPPNLERAMSSILSSLYVTAIEYYRDLGRHVRKKRYRGLVPQPTVPPTSGTSKTLLLQDWQVRYDFKFAVLAEFCQELEAASRSLEAAYQGLFGPDVFDMIPSWSPRWNEARLLADVISIRRLRLHLWMGQPSLAVRKWQLHRDRMASFIDRQGRGTNNYGWQAWEARWAMVMASIMEQVEIPGLASSTGAIFLEPEKALLGERMQPWELLHHTGYWYRIAARHLASRRALAHMIPDEDRTAPDSSHVATKGYTYDTYLCPPPHQEYPLRGKGVNHSQLIVTCLLGARSQFLARKQNRIAAEISLECAREMASIESWKEVVAMLGPLWEDSIFRSEWWLDISEEVLWLMRRAAAAIGRGDLVVAIDWELMDKRFTRMPKWHYDLNKSLDGISCDTKPSITISDDVVSSFISADFVFRHHEGKAGETCLAQLSLKSDAMQGSQPVTLSMLQINFEGGLKPIIIEHAPTAGSANPSSDAVSVTTVSLQEHIPEEDESDDEDDDSDDDSDEEEEKEEKKEKKAVVKGKCELTLRPGQKRVFEMNIPLREPGDISAASVIVSCRTDNFDLDNNLKFRPTDKATGWFTSGLVKPRLLRPDGHALHIQPRPPKMKLSLVNPIDQYYANEPVFLRVALLNEEDDSANVKVDVNITGKAVPHFQLEAGEHKAIAEATEEESHTASLVLGHLKSSSSSEILIRLDPAQAPTAFEVQARALYHLDSDVATPIVQVLTLNLNIVNAFEANYDLVPRLHPDSWPSLFDYEGLQNEDENDVNRPQGLAQQWCLVCHYASFAAEDLEVVGVDMQVTSVSPGGQCTVATRPEIPDTGIIIVPKTMHEAQFDLVIQKASLDDKHPIAVDLAFMIRWRRHGAGSEKPTVNTTTMEVGQYLVLGAEPRVLASVLHSSPDMSGLVQLDVTIENPSNHFLTFGLTMEPSDAFAFSGSKQTTIHLLPLSRRTRTYRLLPLVRGVYLRPGLVVKDKYFQKVLRIIPTEGMKIDKDGLLVWVPPAPDASGATTEESSEAESE